MAFKQFSYKVEVTHDANDRTVAQFLVPTDGRTLLHRIAIMPRGSTGASAPLKFILGIQDGAGSGNADNGGLIKESPGYDEDILTTVLKTFEDPEPGLTEKNWISLHQQSSLIWTPPHGPIVMSEAERWGLVYAVSQSAITIAYQFFLEE